MGVNDSLKRELEDLERTGRISAHDQREIHAGFGFESIKRDPQPAVPAASNDVGAQLDDAWSRLKRRIGSE